MLRQFHRPDTPPTARTTHVYRRPLIKCIALIRVYQAACVFLLVVSSVCLAQKAQYSYEAGSRTFRMDGGDVTYIVGVNERGELQPVYWGSSLQPGDHAYQIHAIPTRSSFEQSRSESPEEFSGWGQGLEWEPDLKITFPDGNRDLVLHYVSHRLLPDGLEVQLKDILRDVVVLLHYSIDSQTGIIARSAVIINRTQAPLIIEQAAAATWTLPRGSGYMLHFLTGRWAAEWQLQTRPVSQGATVLESRIGSTSHTENPFFAIGSDGTVTEDKGDVWFGELGWSGSWRITVEQDGLQQVRITGGNNPFDFGYKLAPLESLSTPIFYAGHTTAGYGEASRLLHRFQLSRILPGEPEPKLRPVLYDSWEATGFDVSEESQIALAKKASSIGVERFVMDDGWFGARNTDNAGLGDWYVNKQKFPHGLKPVIDAVHSLGMDFGLWVEPEMVNPDSNLYREHPDWVLHFGGRPRSEARNQLVLNLAIPEVQQYVFNSLDQLLSENQISFLKWDYNRPWSEPGWPAVWPDEQKKVYVATIDSLYSILARLRAKHPDVEIESCSSGGGRVDLGILRYTDDVWPSDNTDAFDRLSIQEGFTNAYAPGIMMAWVTDVPSFTDNRSVSLPYRFLVAMQGGLGIGSNLNKWSSDDFATAIRMVAQYKSIRHTIQRGELYRLVTSFNRAEHSAVETVSTDKKQAVIFAYLHSSSDGYAYPRIYLQGLNSTAIYSARQIEGQLATDTPSSASGDYWMHHGIDVLLKGDFQAAAFAFEEQ